MCDREDRFLHSVLLGRSPFDQTPMGMQMAVAQRGVEARMMMAGGTERGGRAESRSSQRMTYLPLA